MSIADKLTTIAENVPKVYDAGKKAEYDAFWDAHQCDASGTPLKVCRYMFAGNGWHDANFKPKYKMEPTNAEGMFRYSSCQYGLYDNKDKFDFSNCTTLSQAFAYSGTLKKIGTVDTRKTSSASDLNYLFANSTALEWIDKLILKVNGTQTFTNTFSNANALVHIDVEGVIGNDVDFKSCPLDKASFESVVSALSDTVTGKTITFKKTAKEAAFTADEWVTLTATKPNWTFNLV